MLAGRRVHKLKHVAKAVFVTEIFDRIIDSIGGNVKRYGALVGLVILDAGLGVDIKWMGRRGIDLEGIGGTTTQGNHRILCGDPIESVIVFGTYWEPEQ